MVTIGRALKMRGLHLPSLICLLSLFGLLLINSCSAPLEIPIRAIADKDGTLAAVQHRDGIEGVGGSRSFIEDLSALNNATYQTQIYHGRTRLLPAIAYRSTSWVPAVFDPDKGMVTTLKHPDFEKTSHSLYSMGFSPSGCATYGGPDHDYLLTLPEEQLFRLPSMAGGGVGRSGTGCLRAASGLWLFRALVVNEAIRLERCRMGSWEEGQCELFEFVAPVKASASMWLVAALDLETVVLGTSSFGTFRLDIEELRLSQVSSNGILGEYYQTQNGSGILIKSFDVSGCPGSKLVLVRRNSSAAQAICSDVPAFGIWISEDLEIWKAFNEEFEGVVIPH